MKLASSILFALVAISAATAQSIVDVANSAGLTTLLQLVIAADLADDLTNGAANLTVLAPTNDAFAALPASTVTALTQKYNKDLLQKVLLYHVLANRYPSSVVQTLVGGNTPATLEGSTIPVTSSGGNLFLGGKQVVVADVNFFNGDKRSVAHVINGVLIPPSFSLPPTITDLVVALNGQGQFTQLFKALTSFGTEFTDLLSNYNANGYTVFAPTNAAWNQLPKRFRTFPLSQRCKVVVRRILRYHVVPRSIASTSLKDNQKLKTLLLTAKLEVNRRRGNVFIDDARVVQADVRASNGVIHAINEVLLP